MKRSSINSIFSFCSPFILYAFLFIPFFSQAQYIEEYPINQGNANKMMEIKNYPEAVRIFKALLEEKPNNIDYKHQLGLAYVHSNINQERGLSLLEEVAKSANAPDDMDKDLALAYFKNYEFDKSSSLYSSLLASTTDSSKAALFKDGIANCKTASKIVQHPVPIRFENLGNRVNSIAPDYLPLVTPDESMIIFTTKRKGVVGNLYDYSGYRTSDIYLAKHRGNKYSKARSIGSPNTYGNEESAGTSENGRYMSYHVDSDDSYSDLFISEKGRRSYMPPKDFASKTVNTKDNEPGGSLNNDGTVLYFCSNRDGGFGGYDIYMVRRLPNNDWGEAINLGPNINTAKDEKYPFIRNNEKEIYFSSNGHKGMGGLDLFKSVWIDDEWTSPVNLGYPINTTSDDASICFTENPRYAYIAASRPGGEGDLDIYRIVFEDKREELCLVNVNLIYADSSSANFEVQVDVIDRDTEDIVGNYFFQPKKGKLHAILPPGKYRLEIFENENYHDVEQKFNINDKNDFISNLNIDLMVKLKPPPVNQVKPTESGETPSKLEE